MIAAKTTKKTANRVKITARPPTSIPNSSTIHRAILPNGIEVLVYENPAVQSVNVISSLHAGSIYENPRQNGLASFTARALMTGTESRSFDALHGALEDIGAELSIRSHMHKTGISGKALAEDLAPLLMIMTDALQNPTFPAEHVERLRGERLTWLQYSHFNTRYRAAKAMREALYPSTHPYHYAPTGSEETLAQITRADLQDFHAAHFGPRGMLLTIVGAVKAADAIALTHNAFGDWQNPAQPPRLTVSSPPPANRQTQFVEVPGKTQSDISMAVVGPARRAADYLPARLANSVLGVFGMMGRIGKNVREEKGLAYYAYSQLDGGHGPDPWTISAGVNPDKVELAIESIAAEIERLITEAVSASDLADNQSYFTGRLPLQLESNEGLAANIHSMASYRLGLDYLANYKESIYRITRADLLQAAQRYLKPQAMVTAVAGPPPSSAAP